MSRNDILRENCDRFLLLPVEDHEAWKFYKDAIANFWTAEEVDLGADRFDLITGADRKLLKLVLGFFAAADGIVGENLATNLIPQVQQAEIRAFYAFQMAIETVHAEVYGLLIETYVNDPAERNEMFRAVNNIASVKKLGDWAMLWTDASKQTFAARLVAFACVEGILFAAPFAVIFYYKTRGVLPGLCKSNEWIARDETQHMMFACFLYRDRLLPEQKESTQVVHSIVSECVQLQKEFIRDALDDMPGLNATTLGQYVEFVADVLLVSMGVDKLFGSANPFSWMTMIGMPAKTNFFEGRVTEYKRAAGAGAEIDDNALRDAEVDF